MYSMINVACTIIIMFIILLYIHGFPYYGPYYGPNYGSYNDPYYNYYGRRKYLYFWYKIKDDWAYLSGIYGRCFSGDSLVKLSNGKDKRIDSINIGDQILTIDQSKLVSTDVIMMLDKHISKKGILIMNKFVKIYLKFIFF